MMQVLSETMPSGKFYYVVTPNPTDRKRQYLYELKRPEGEFGIPLARLSPVRAMAKKFDNLILARAYCNFLNRVEGGEEFCVALEG